MTNWNEVLKVIDETLEYVEKEQIYRHYDSMADGMSDWEFEKCQNDETTDIGILFKNDCVGLADFTWDELRAERPILVAFRDKQNLAETLAEKLTTKTIKHTPKQLKI